MTHRRPLVLNPIKLISQLPAGDSVVTIPRSGPASSIGTAADYPGELYIATDEANTYRSDGTSWSKVGTGSVSEGVVETIVAGTNITVDATDPANPIISATGGGGGGGTVDSVVAGTDVAVDATDPANPIVSLDFGTITAHYFLAGPNSGSPAAPTFRALTKEDTKAALLAALVAGTNITITDNGNGTYTFAASGGGGGSGDMVKAASNACTWEMQDAGKTVANSFICANNLGSVTGNSLFTYASGGIVVGGTMWDTNSGKVTHGAYGGYDFCSNASLSTNWTNLIFRVKHGDLHSYIDHTFGADILVTGKGLFKKEMSSDTPTVARAGVFYNWGDLFNEGFLQVWGNLAGAGMDVVHRAGKYGESSWGAATAFGRGYGWYDNTDLTGDPIWFIHGAGSYVESREQIRAKKGLAVTVVGYGVQVKEGTNAKSGIATLVAGTVTVPTTAVGASSRIQLTAQNLGTITVPAALAVSARNAGTDFTILSSNVLDTSDVAWFIIDPA